MLKKSAGLLLFRETAGQLEVLLVHPGGPFWANKDEGAWSIPKGECDEDEALLGAARREVEEELGVVVTGNFIPLQPVRQSGGKVVYAWAVRSQFDRTALKSNTFTMEWPPKSGRMREFPEVDRAAWLSIDAAKKKIISGQAPLLVELQAKFTSDERDSRSG